MTPRDVDQILEKLSELQVAIARLEERIDGHESHEARIRKVEKWQAGLAAIVGFVVIELQIVGVAMAVLARTSGQ